MLFALEGSHSAKPPLKERLSCSHSLWAKYFHVLFRMLLRGMLFCSHHFIYSNIHLYLYRLRDIYFTFWFIIQYYFLHIFAQILLLGSCVPLTYLHLHGICLLPLLSSFPFPSLHFLTFDTTSCSRPILYIANPVLESSSSSRKFDSFDWRIVFKTKIWMLCVLVAIGVSLLLGIFSWKERQYLCMN